MKKIIAGCWQLFKRTPLGRLIRFLSPQWLVNLLEHFPVAILANIIYGFPSKKVKVIGVTGTDGKTTTVNMLYQILKDAGRTVSMVSTVNGVIGDKTFKTGFHTTSPHSFYIQEYIKKAVRAGSEYIVLEVTSHSLDQHRFLGVKFDVGVITNITPEHLDYHKTFEKYFKTKLKLVKNAKFAVINKEIQETGEISGKKFTFGLLDGDFNQKELKLKLKVPGNYNTENALAAIGVASVLGIEKKLAVKSLENFKGVLGRMEEIENRRDIRVIVDFAHTPNGLQQALTTLREQSKGQLIALIGAEGQRDVEKRPKLGEIAARLADVVILTAVDPRGQLQKINEQILQGAKKAGASLDKNLFVVDDREEAINFAINKLAGKGDIVGIFGKGHETTLNYAGKETPWSDQQAALKALNNG